MLTSDFRVSVSNITPARRVNTIVSEFTANPCQLSNSDTCRRSRMSQKLTIIDCRQSKVVEKAFKTLNCRQNRSNTGPYVLVLMSESKIIYCCHQSTDMIDQTLDLTVVLVLESVIVYSCIQNALI